MLLEINSKVMHFFFAGRVKVLRSVLVLFSIFIFIFFSLHVVAPRDLRQGIYRRPGIRYGLKTKKKRYKNANILLTSCYRVFFRIFLARLDKEEDGGGRWLFGSIEQVGRMG